MAIGRDVIKGEVVPVLEHVSHMPVKDDESEELTADLLISALLREALSATWTKISRSHGGEAVSRNASLKARTVKAVIDLVHKQANVLAKTDA